MSVDLGIGGGQSAGGEGQLSGGEVQLSGGEGQSADVDAALLKVSTNNSDGRHSLGKRTRKEHDELLVKRFKVPFSLECKGCESVIAEGVRINAEKKLAGHYYEKKIWSFTIECAYCGQKIVMERISKDSKYEVVEGARRKRAKHQLEAGHQVDGHHLQPGLEWRRMFLESMGRSTWTF